MPFLANFAPKIAFFQNVWLKKYTCCFSLKLYFETRTAFMLLFTAFQTASMGARYVTDSLKADRNRTANGTLTEEELDSIIGDGYISNSVLYARVRQKLFYGSKTILKIKRKSLQILEKKIKILQSWKIDHFFRKSYEIQKMFRIF